MSYRILLYINQFFAGIGGEEKADIPLSVEEKVLGPGLAFARAFGDEAEIVATIVCGDNYFALNMDAVNAEVVDLARRYAVDGVLAGPGFNAGRYGTACASVCAAVQRELHIPAVTGLYAENPGVDLFRKELSIVETPNSARGMGKAVPAMVRVLLKKLKGEPLGSPAEEGLLERGARINMFYPECGAERAVSMLVQKLRGEAFTTEYPMPVFDRVTPRPGVKDLAHAKIALVTSGGIVPFGNPDHIAASSAQNFGEYDLTGVTDLREGEYQTAHGGYDQTYANQDADRVLPVDVLRDLEQEGKIGSLHHFYYSTVGNGTSVDNANIFGLAIGKRLRDAGVQAVILTST